MKPIKLLIVDDSLFMCRLITDLVEKDPGIEVVGTAADGLECLEKIKELSPDIITLDIEMPRLDGLETLKRIMNKRPLPVIMLSSLTSQGADATVKALQLGAVGFIHKPSGAVSLDIAKVGLEIVSKIKEAMFVNMKNAKRAIVHIPRAPRTTALPPKTTKRKKLSIRSSQNIIAIGSSTGGPKALLQVMGDVSADINAGIIIVQHMPVGFTASLAEHLDSQSVLTVREAKNGDRLKDGLVLVAPGGYHLIMEKDGKIHLCNKIPPVLGLRPTVDNMMESVARVYKENVIGVVLTGMGHDGTEGMRAIKAFKGRTIAESKSTALIFGMPKSVVDNDLADRVVPIYGIASEMEKMCKRPLYHD